MFTGLKRLEYRGYDSSGMCIDAIDAPTPTGRRESASGDGLANGSSADGTSSSNGRVEDRSSPIIVKCPGKIENLENLTAEYVQQHNLDTSKVYKHHVAISHTRWATHGVPSAINAHPQVSDANADFVVVHNGIITNYQALKDILKKNGETFVSETDTETIPKLLKFAYDSMTAEAGSGEAQVPFPKLVMEVLTKLEGAYALLIKSRHYPGELVACKRGSPMIVGIKEGPDGSSSSSKVSSGGLGRAASITRLRDQYNDSHWTGALEAWVASDASAVIEHTKRVVVLEDNDVLHIVGGGYGIYNTRQADVETAVPRRLQVLQLEVDQIMKGGYEHYMQKEIHEQPEAITQSMRGRVKQQKSAEGNPYLQQRIKLGGLVETRGNPYLQQRIKLGGLVETRDTIRRSRRIMFVACGTSYHAALAARQTVEEMVEVPVVLELASDLLDRCCPIFRDDTCVFVSQSGETADTLRALEYAKARGALCVGITNTVGSAISRATHCGIHQNAGYEIGVASTKAYTSQIICITMMALALAEDSISKRERRDAIIDELGALPDKMRSFMQVQDVAMKELAAQLKDSNSLLFFARGNNYATALEAALKCKEVALIHSEGILAGEMKHGPLALVDEHLPIVVVATRDSMYNKMESVIQQLLARSARLIILCTAGDATMQEYAKRSDCQLIEVPGTVEPLQPILNIVPLQLLAYHMTVLRGHNVDQPRNLAKSVTVTD
uniref:glutamine--fructose-6-phosphate transaminase (isomerizing) n=1 Tax=Tetradesmus obliquus TaxID=3088 RepID=A0A383VJC3_TETOB